MITLRNYLIATRQIFTAEEWSKIRMKWFIIEELSSDNVVLSNEEYMEKK